jgi:hypothetical protein
MLENVIMELDDQGHSMGNEGNLKHRLMGAVRVVLEEAV